MQLLAHLGYNIIRKELSFCYNSPGNAASV